MANCQYVSFVRYINISELGVTINEVGTTQYQFTINNNFCTNFMFFNIKNIVY